MLPESFDPELLRNIAIGGLLLVVVVAFLVLRFIQKMVLRVVLLGALFGVGLYVWGQRQELQDCVPTCACEFFGIDVQLPAEADAACRAAGRG